jgi:membrane protease YdiL (CAAX protease family)
LSSSLSRGVAVLEVILCSGFPTQLAVIALLRLAGVAPHDAAGRLSVAFVTSLSLIDAALIITLVVLFLRSHAERPRDLLLGQRPLLPEVAHGIFLIPAAFILVVLVMSVLLSAAPWLRNVPRNPLEDLMTSSGDRLVFGLVVIVAGGVREEIQRAFILHRFEQRLGGALVGLVVFSAAFGLGHLDQGRDIAIATATLGAFWGWIYLRRRSIVAPAVSHAGFNVAEILRHVLLA